MRLPDEWKGPYIDRRDWWIGVFVDRQWVRTCVYVCLLPCVVIRLTWIRR